MSGLPQYRVVVQFPVVLDFETLTDEEVADVEIRLCFRELGSTMSGCPLGRVDLDPASNITFNDSLLVVDLRGNAVDLSSAYPSGFLMAVQVASNVFSRSETEVNVSVEPGELDTVGPIEVAIGNKSANVTATVGVICSNYTGPRCNISALDETTTMVESTTMDSSSTDPEFSTTSGDPNGLFVRILLRDPPRKGQLPNPLP